MRDFFRPRPSLEPPWVRHLRALGGALLAPLLWLFVAAGMCPLPTALSGPGTLGQSVRFTDRHGALLREVRAGERGERAQWIDLSDVPPHVVDALLVTEDRRFYEHVGIDPRGVVRAAITSLAARRVTSGASTLTMQLARLVAPHPRTARGKLGEMRRAVRIEMSLSKAQILEQYLNRAPFGPNVTGVAAASRHWFDKPPRALSVSEGASLVALVRGPTYYDPRKHEDRLLARRNRILGLVAGKGLLSQEELRVALREPLTLARRPRAFVAPHFIDAVGAGMLGPAPSTRETQVTTTLDSALQLEAESLTADVLAGLSTRDATAAAAVVLANDTGQVLAYVGSPHWGDEASQGHNDGVLARRQPGSTLKPFLYALSMEQLGTTPATLLEDVPTTVRTEAGPYTPRNYDGRFRGPVRLREALASSLNVPAVVMAERVGVGQFLSKLRAVGLGTLDRTPSFYGPALALGDGEVRLLDLTAAYRVLARGGLRGPVQAVLGAEKEEGRERGRAARAGEARVLGAAASAMVSSILEDGASRAGAFGLATPFDLPFAVAAKTGTSKGYRDNWAVGFSRHVTVGVWVGNFDGRPMNHVSGITGAGPLFHRLMEAAERRAGALGLSETGELGREDGGDLLEPRQVCALSGGAMGSACTHGVREWLPSGHALKPCSMHVRVRVDVRNGGLAGPACGSAVVREENVEHFEGPLAAWAREAGRPAGPDHASPLCPGGARPVDHDPEVLFPPPGARFLLDPDRRASAETLAVRLRGQGGGPAALWVDGRYQGTAEGGASVPWRLRKGSHVLLALAGGRKSPPVTIHVE